MGVGDEIMVTGEARRLQQTDPRKVLVVERDGRPRWHPVWTGNPRIARPGEPDVQTLRNAGGCRPYIDYRRSTKTRWAYTDWRATPGEIYFTAAERDFALAIGCLAEPFVVIEPNIKAKASPNKDWGFARWQGVVRLMPGVRFVQVGPVGVRKLDGASHVVTQDVRFAFAVLSRAAAYIGPEGGLHHAAAALGRPAVVVFGSMMSPVNTAYEGHVNVTIEDDHSPCGLRIPCPRCRANFDNLQPADVADKLKDIL